MIIKQEDFKKLDQLDRIEFLLRLKRIEDKAEISFVSPIYMAVFMGWFILLFTLSYTVLGINFIIRIMPMFRLAVYFFVLLWILEAVINFVIIFKARQRKEELERDFFNVNQNGKQKTSIHKH
jgi:hypothetical protein